MEILPKEVESVKTIGNLHGEDVKLVKTRGGFYIAVGKKGQNTKKAEALAAGSHGAIVNHALSKEYGQSFQPAIFKSEQDQLEDVKDRSCFLSKNLSDKGLELYVLNKNNNLDFVLYRHGLTVGEYKAEISQNSLLIKSHTFNNKLYSSEQVKEISEAIAGVMDEAMKENGLSKVENKYL